MSHGLFSVSRFTRCLGTALFCLCGTWSLSAQTVLPRIIIQEEEEELQIGVRVASAEYVANSSPATFARPTIQPWNTLGPQTGYLSVRVAEAFQHPLLMTQLLNVHQIIEGALLPADDGTPRRLSESGFSLENISGLEATATLSFVPIPEAERDESGATRKLGFGVNGSNNGFAIHSNVDIDWPKLFAALDYARVLGRDAADGAREAFVKSSRPGRDVVFNSKTSTEARTMHKALTYRQKQMWNEVNGGVATVFTNLSSPHVQQLEQNALEPTGPVAARVFEETWTQINSIAAGADFSAGIDGEKVRVALEPRPGLTADQLAAQVKTLRQTLIATLAAGETKGMTDSFRKLIIQHLQDARIVVVGTESGSYVLLTGQISIAKMIEAH